MTFTRRCQVQIQLSTPKTPPQKNAEMMKKPSLFGSMYACPGHACTSLCCGKVGHGPTTPVAAARIPAWPKYLPAVTRPPYEVLLPLPSSSLL